MDTAVHISIYLENQEQETPARAAIESAFDEMAQLDSLMSSFRDDSEVASVNRAASTAHQEAEGNAKDLSVAISSHLDTVIRTSLEFGQLSGGALDITIAPVLKLWGFGTEAPAVPAATELDSATQLVDFRNLALEEIQISADLPRDEFRPTARLRFKNAGMAIDLGAVAKGYIVDRAFELLHSKGYGDLLVEAGGDLRSTASDLTEGRRRIWIQHPRNPEEFFANFHFNSGAVATSGDYERFFEKNGRRYHHILNPRTGYPAGMNDSGVQTVSATAVTTTTMRADALSTAVFVMGPEEGIDLAERLPQVETVVMFFKNGELNWKATSGLSKKLKLVE